MTSTISQPSSATRDQAVGTAAARAAYRRYALAWLAGPLIGIANGATRELTYGRVTGGLRAHQISSAAGVALFGAYFAWLARRWPIPNARTAFSIGAMWVALTVAFEFGFGRRAGGKSWSALLRDYDIRRGRVWGLVVVWIGIAPAVMRVLVQPRDASR